MPRSGKGKRKATGNDSESSSDSSAEDAPDRDHGPSPKRPHLHSSARVKQVAMAKIASKSGSSSKGLAIFTSLVNNANLTAAHVETNRGLRSSSSSKRPCGDSSTRSHVDKPVFPSYFYIHGQI